MISSDAKKTNFKNFVKFVNFNELQTCSHELSVYDVYSVFMPLPLSRCSIVNVKCLQATDFLVFIFSGQQIY